MRQTFSIVADVEKSIFTLYFSDESIPTNGDIFAKLYYDINGVTTEEMLPIFEEHLRGALTQVCLTFKWSKSTKDAPKYPITELYKFADISKRNTAINKVLDNV